MTNGLQPSLWARQLAALGIDDRAHATAPALVSAEAERIDRLELPALDLPAAPPRPRAARPDRHWSIPTSFRWLGAGAALAAAAAVAMLIWLPRTASDDTLTVKGGTQVWVWWERDGSAHPLAAGDVLADGDRIRAEVLMTDDGTAYQAVTDGLGRLLSQPADVWASAMRLQGGVRAAFPGSLRLTGESEGEILVILVCESDGLAESVVAAVARGQGEPLVTEGLPAGCGMHNFPLR